MDEVFPWIVIRYATATANQCVVVAFATTLEEIYIIFDAYRSAAQSLGSPAIYAVRAWNYVQVPGCWMIGKQAGTQVVSE